MDAVSRCAACANPLPAPGNTAALEVTFGADTNTEWTAYLFCSPTCLAIWSSRGDNRAMLWELVGRPELAEAARAGVPALSRVLLAAPSAFAGEEAGS